MKRLARRLCTAQIVHLAPILGLPHGKFCKINKTKYIDHISFFVCSYFGWTTTLSLKLTSFPNISMRLFIPSARWLCIHHGIKLFWISVSWEDGMQERSEFLTGECSTCIYLQVPYIYCEVSSDTHFLFFLPWELQGGGEGWLETEIKSHWWRKQQGMGHDRRWMWESFPVLSFWDQSPTFKLSNTGDGLTRFCFSISEVIECIPLGLGR